MESYKKIDPSTVEITNVKTKDLNEFQTALQSDIDDLTLRIAELQTAQDSYTDIIQAEQDRLAALQKKQTDVSNAKVGDAVVAAEAAVDG